MSKVESIEEEIEKLSPDELAAFRRWYSAFDAEVWDRQFESDVKAGRLDALADEALRAHTSGQSRFTTPHQILVLLQRVTCPDP